jgi:hypothetical protein
MEVSPMHQLNHELRRMKRSATYFFSEIEQACGVTDCCTEGSTVETENDTSDENQIILSKILEKGLEFKARCKQLTILLAEAEENSLRDRADDKKGIPRTSLKPTMAENRYS